MRNRSQIFLGLFLIMFGLFAAQLKKKTPAVETKPESVLSEEPVPTPSSQNRIQILYDKVSLEKVFSNRIGGVKLEPKHPPLKGDFTVTFYGDEIFTDQGFSIHDSWLSTLDFLAGLIKTEPGLHVEISGYADEANPKEQKPGDYGSSALSFSFARAEWLAHYFERKHGITISKYFVLRGMGAVPQGKKIELRFHYGS